jgi:hypothetical protein
MTRISSVAFSIVFIISSILLELIAAMGCSPIYLQKPRSRKPFKFHIKCDRNAAPGGAGTIGTTGMRGRAKLFERSEAVERLEQFERPILRTLEL